MAITANGLQQLGFEPKVDFDLQNNSDGQQCHFQYMFLY